MLCARTDAVCGLQLARHDLQPHRGAVARVRRDAAWYACFIPSLPACLPALRDSRAHAVVVICCACPGKLICTPTKAYYMADGCDLFHQPIHSAGPNRNRSAFGMQFHGEEGRFPVQEGRHRQELEEPLGAAHRQNHELVRA